MKLRELTEVKMNPQITQNHENIDDVLVGFEIECIINMKNHNFPQPYYNIQNYNYHMNAQHQSLKFQLLKIHEISSFIYDVVEDGSLEGSEVHELCTEIITKPIPYKQSIKALTSIIKVLKEQYQMRTNKWCSLHVNMSCNGTRTNNIDLLKLVTFLGEKYFLSKFDRINNEYAHEVQSIFNTILPEEITPSTWIIDRLKNRKQQLFKFVTKFFSINPNKLKNGYLEYRIIGGKNYEMDLQKIEHAVSHFAHIMLIASSNENEKEYNKKLVNILNKLIDKKYDNSTNLTSIEQEVLNIIVRNNPAAKNNVEKLDRHDLILFILHHYDSSILNKIPANIRTTVDNHIKQLQFEYGKSNKSESLDDINFIKKIVEKIGGKNKWNDKNTLSNALFYLYSALPSDEDKYLQQYPNFINNLSDYELKRLIEIIDYGIENGLVSGFVNLSLKTFRHMLIQFKHIV